MRAVAHVATLEREAGARVLGVDEQLGAARPGPPGQPCAGRDQPLTRELGQLVRDGPQLGVGHVVGQVHERPHPVGHAQQAVGDDVAVIEMAGAVDHHARARGDVAGRGDVDRGPRVALLGDPAVERRGRLVRQRGVLSGPPHRGEEVRMPRDRTVPEHVDARVQPVQAPRSHAVQNGVPGHPKRHEVSPAHEPLLPLGELDERRVGGLEVLACHCTH